MRDRNNRRENEFTGRVRPIVLLAIQTGRPTAFATFASMAPGGTGPRGWRPPGLDRAFVDEGARRASVRP